jgi:CheY-like chemotaxis protein
VQHFTSGADLERWYNGQSPVLFLCDYEFLGAKETGLDIIERLGIQRQSILVTSRFEEESVMQRCMTMGVKLIPKGLAGFVPIEIMATCHPEQHADPSVVALPQDDTMCVPQIVGVKPTVLVIDDDAGIRMAWELEQERLGVGDLQAYASMEACEAAAPDYAQYDFAFVDKNIPESTWRIDQMIQHLKNRGVKKVMVASGEAADAVKKDVLCQDADGFSSTKIPETLDG